MHIWVSPKVNLVVSDKKLRPLSLSLCLTFPLNIALRDPLLLHAYVAYLLWAVFVRRLDTFNSMPDILARPASPAPSSHTTPFLSASNAIQAIQTQIEWVKVPFESKKLPTEQTLQLQP